jgi:hypothetical protein
MTDWDQLEKLAGDKRFIPGIYNYCDRWCERCPQTSHCLTFFLSEKEFSDPETQDMRNEAFWRKLSGILGKTLELLTQAAKKWGIDLETLNSKDDIENMKAKDEAAKNHLLSRAAKRYSEMVEDWFTEREMPLLETAAAAREGVDLEEAFEVIRWYQYFISAKVMRAVRGKVEEEEEGCDEFEGDSNGSAKIALIAMDRSIAAWGVARYYDTHHEEKALDIIAFLDRLRQAMEKTFPRARSFIRPGFERIDLNG